MHHTNKRNKYAQRNIYRQNGDFNMCSLGVVTLSQGQGLRLNPLDVTPDGCGKNMSRVSKEVPSIEYYP